MKLHFVIEASFLASMIETSWHGAKPAPLDSVYFDGASPGYWAAGMNVGLTAKSSVFIVYIIWANRVFLNILLYMLLPHIHIEMEKYIKAYSYRKLYM